MPSRSKRRRHCSRVEKTRKPTKDGSSHPTSIRLTSFTDKRFFIEKKNWPSLSTLFRSINLIIFPLKFHFLGRARGGTQKRRRRMNVAIGRRLLLASSAAKWRPDHSASFVHGHPPNENQFDFDANSSTAAGRFT